VRFQECIIEKIEAEAASFSFLSRGLAGSGQRSTPYGSEGIIDGRKCPEVDSCRKEFLDWKRGPFEASFKVSKE
jgi:hypothetical protein